MIHDIDAAPMAEWEIARHLPEGFEGENTIDQTLTTGAGALQRHCQRDEGLGGLGRHHRSPVDLMVPALPEEGCGGAIPEVSGGDREDSGDAQIFLPLGIEDANLHEGWLALEEAMCQLS